MPRAATSDPWAFDPNDPFSGLDPSAVDDVVPPDAPSAGEAPAGRTAHTMEGYTPDEPGGAGPSPDVPDVNNDTPAAPDPNDPMAPGNQPSAAGVGAPGNATNAIIGFYGKYLGRPPENDAAIKAWITSGKSLAQIENAIANSAEATAYAKAHGLGPYAPAANTAATSTAGGPLASPNGTGNVTADQLIAAMMSRLSGLYNASPTGSQVDPEIRGRIMSALSTLIDKGLEPIGDVSNSQQAKAYQIASQRNAEQSRSAAAERRAASGMLFSGPMETDVNAIDQQRAEKQAAFEAQLTTTLLTDRQQKLSTALQVGAGIMSADQQTALQAELQSVNAELAKSTLQLNLTNSILANSRFYDDLGYRIGATQAGLNSQAGSSLV